MSIEEIKKSYEEYVISQVQAGEILFLSATVNELRMMSHKKKRIRKKYEDKVLRRDRMVA